MLAIQPSSTSKPLKPNILPCKITHSGPLPISKRHWNPQSDVTPKDSNTPISHLRGRRLKGRVVKLPAGYQGILAKKTEQVLPPAGKKVVVPEEDGDDEMGGADEDIEVRVMEQKGTFDEIMVWGHEVVPDGEDVKGIEEWIGFAESIHAYDVPEANGS